MPQLLVPDGSISLQGTIAAGGGNSAVRLAGQAELEELVLEPWTQPLGLEFEYEADAKQMALRYLKGEWAGGQIGGDVELSFGSDASQVNLTWQNLQLERLATLYPEVGRWQTDSGWSLAGTSLVQIAGGINLTDPWGPQTDIRLRVTGGGLASAADARRVLDELSLDINLAEQLHAKFAATACDGKLAAGLRAELASLAQVWQGGAAESAGSLPQWELEWRNFAIEELAQVFQPAGDSPAAAGRGSVKLAGNVPVNLLSALATGEATGENLSAALTGGAATGSWSLMDLRVDGKRIAGDLRGQLEMDNGVLAVHGERSQFAGGTVEVEAVIPVQRWNAPRFVRPEFQAT